MTEDAGSTGREIGSPTGAGSSEVLSEVRFEEWRKWIEEADTLAATSGQLLPSYIDHRVGLGSTTQTLMKSLCVFGDRIQSHEDASKRLETVARLFVLPFVVSRGLNVEELLRNCPIPIHVDSGLVESVGTLLTKWGFQTS
jgi:hypothetical protein